MGPIKLTDENREILREYYINLYVIELKDCGIYEDSMYAEIVSSVDYMIKRYESNGHIKASFSRYMTSHNPIYEKYRNSLMPISEKLVLIKQGNLKYLETLIDYYKNILKLNINLMYIKQSFDNKDQIINEGLKFIENSIRKYFNTDYKSKFVRYMANNMQSFFLKYNLKGNCLERSIIIDNKNGIIDQRKTLYDKYYNLACDKVKNTNNIPEEKYKLLLKALVDSRIDSYFNGKEKNSSLRNYLEMFCNRLCNAPEQIIVKYNLLFDDFYDESISFIEQSIKEYISTYIKENNINKISLIYRLTAFTKELAKDYLDMCIIEKRYIPFKPWLSLCVNNFTKEQKTKSSFDFDLAINGSVEDKQSQLKILREELAYLKDKAKEKYIYYTDASSANDKIDTCYNNIMNSYVNNIIVKKDFQRRTPSRYISTRLFERAKSFSNSTKRNFEKKEIGQVLCEQYRQTVVNYVKGNNMSDEEKSVFFEYMNAVFGNYIKKGSFSIDIRIYLKQFIDSYDYEFAKNVIEIKDFEESSIKVLRRPVIK